MSRVENFIRVLRANPDLTEKLLSLMGSPDFEVDFESDTSIKSPIKNLLVTLKDLYDNNYSETKNTNRESYHSINYFGQTNGNTEKIPTITSKPISPQPETHVSTNQSLMYFGQTN